MSQSGGVSSYGSGSSTVSSGGYGRSSTMAGGMVRSPHDWSGAGVVRRSSSIVSTNGCSGADYDRWVERNSHGQHSTALGRVQRQFWFTKSAVMRKLGKNQDEHVVASDAELDAKMELFKAIEWSTRELQVLLAEYQSKLCVLAAEENAMGRLLKEWSRHDTQATASKVMAATGKSLSYTAQQRLALRAPLVRLFQEVDTFHSRAIEDTGQTLAQMEKLRTEYRGALMWMKKISLDFNPDQYSQLEKFRQVQEIVRQKKAKFDVVKIKSLQKIDLLAASRCNMFSHALILYQNALITFSEKTAKTLNSVATNFQGYQHYNFQVIKELVEPEDRRRIREAADEQSTDDATFLNAEYRDDEPQEEEDPKDQNSTARAKTKRSDSLVNLFDGMEGEDSQGDTGKGGAARGSSQKIDLLTDDDGLLDSETDTQQMLRELFDSPVHKTPTSDYVDELFSCTGAVGGTSQLSGQQQQQQQQQQHFLPSHLLDIGVLDWGDTMDASMISSGGAGSASIPQQGVGQPLQNPLATRESHQDTAAGTAGTAGTADTSQSSARAGLPTGMSGGLSAAAADKDNKVDWYKVFQDIDPLSDPTNSFFAKKGGDVGAC